MPSAVSSQSVTNSLPKNERNENELICWTAVRERASIKADIAIGLTFLEIARIGGEERATAKAQAERIVESANGFLSLTRNSLDTADREWIQTRLAELESALVAFDVPQAPLSGAKPGISQILN